MTAETRQRRPEEIDYSDYDATVKAVMDALAALGFEQNVVDATGDEPCSSLDVGDGRCLDVTVKLAMTCSCCTLNRRHDHDRCEHPCCPDNDIEGAEEFTAADIGQEAVGSVGK